MSRKALIFILGLLVLGALVGIGLRRSAPALPAGRENKINMILKTSDGVKISADWYPAEKAAGYLLLIHMMPATKESWRDFAAEMQKAGFASLAIDLRGHGQSEGGPSGFQKFSDSEHQKSILDLDAAVKFLEKQGAAPSQIYLIGASIGANLALRYLADHPEITKGVLLSAGLNYRGILTEPLVKRLSANKRLLFITSKDDDDNAAMSQTLAAAVPIGAKQQLIVLDSGGHGTNLLFQAASAIKDFLVQ